MNTAPHVWHPTDRPNFFIVDWDVGERHLRVAYSYETPIGFWDDGTWVISENLWGPTTGKHLRWVNDDDSQRIERGEFENYLKEYLNRS